MIKKAAGTSLLFLFGLSCHAAPQFSEFKTPMDGAEWRYQGDRFHCELRQDVAGFGTLVLADRPGRSLGLSLRADWLVNVPVHSESRLVAPQWQHQAPAHTALRLWQWNGRQASMEGDATPYLEALERGLGWQLDVQISQESGYRLSADPIAVRGALEQFRECRTSLVPKPFSEVRHVTLNYRSGQLLPSKAQLNELDNIAAYVAADHRITEVLVDGHTDNVGDHLANLALSRDRADEVGALLHERGVDRSRIQVRGHGERYPLVSNAGSKGRDQNRRVTIRLVRDGQVQEVAGGAR
ncbi:OmpA family protein [Ferrimonas balearica]|uniref:MotY family protein n=1 Tax=Ferrimonas balearica TaxID=44012 RepID=UPI001C990DA3|nr:OmpA family protein [Ferrimonas balearica]MBY5920005.1 OmpA family protein [Ferrimonas balearica]MBY5997310.1 OmpA family protein [Ferrimonas balearica]